MSAESMGDKDVKFIPGIGDAAAENLRAAGCTKAQEVLDKYLDCGRNEAEFLDWMNKEIKVGQQFAKSCVKALKEWCNKHMDKDEDEAKRLKIRIIEKAKEVVKKARADLERAEADLERAEAYLEGLEEEFGKLAI